MDDQSTSLGTSSAPFSSPASPTKVIAVAIRGNSDNSIECGVSLSMHSIACMSLQYIGDIPRRRSELVFLPRISTLIQRVPIHSVSNKQQGDHEKGNAARTWKTPRSPHIQVSTMDQGLVPGRGPVLERPLPCNSLEAKTIWAPRGWVDLSQQQKGCMRATAHSYVYVLKIIPNSPPVTISCSR